MTLPTATIVLGLQLLKQDEEDQQAQTLKELSDSVEELARLRQQAEAWYAEYLSWHANEAHRGTPHRVEDWQLHPETPAELRAGHGSLSTALGNIQERHPGGRHGWGSSIALWRWAGELITRTSAARDELPSKASQYDSMLAVLTAWDKDTISPYAADKLGFSYAVLAHAVARAEQ